MILSRNTSLLPAPYIQILPSTSHGQIDMTDMMTFKVGGDSVQELGTFKSEVSIIMNEGRIILHKWQSNVEPLEYQADPRESHKSNRFDSAQSLSESD